MTASQNGWRVDPQRTNLEFPGGVIPVATSVAPIFFWFVTRYAAEVEPLRWPGCWGYANRPVRGATDISNHASATAVDLNAPEHGLGTDPHSNFTDAEIAAIHRILADTQVNGHPVLRWGGDYVGRKDGMHVEINDGVTEEMVAVLIARIQGQPAPVPPPTPAPAPRPAPAPAPDAYSAWVNAEFGSRTLSQGCQGTDVQTFQRIIGVDADGKFGPGTKARAVDFQAMIGADGGADGIIGAGTIATMDRLPSPKNAPASFQRWFDGYPFKPALLPTIKQYANAFGPKSQHALSQVQSRYGLAGDGVPGRLTNSLLRRLGWRG